MEQLEWRVALVVAWLMNVRARTHERCGRGKLTLQEGTMQR